MPIIDVEIVTAAGEVLAAGLTRAIADAAGEVFETPPGRTWVRLRTLDRAHYAENGGPVADQVEPVFVTVFKAIRPSDLAVEMHRLAEAVALACDRPIENVHVLYEPECRGRIGFGGKLVE